MKRKILLASLSVLILAYSTNLYSQILAANRWGYGLNVGAQKIYGGVQWKTGFGFGMEAYARYNISPRFFTIGSFGYGELSDGTLIFDKCTFNANLTLKSIVTLIFPSV